MPEPIEQLHLESDASQNTVSQNTQSNETVSQNTVSNHALSDAGTVSDIGTSNNTPSDISHSTYDDQGSTTVNTETIVYHEGFFYTAITNDIKARINGLSYKEDCIVPYDDLRYLNVLYVDFNNVVQTGEIVCNKAIAQDLLEIFYELYIAGYQIDKIRLIDEYNADDDLSCLDNNTSCFNYRNIGGTNNLSKHALGLAIDINPFYNPYVTYPDGNIRISPPGSEPYADREADFLHKIDENDLCYRLFTERGFTWGGHWKSLKDYQHFQKALD